MHRYPSSSGIFFSKILFQCFFNTIALIHTEHPPPVIIVIIFRFQIHSLSLVVFVLASLCSTQNWLQTERIISSDSTGSTRIIPVDILWNMKSHTARDMRLAIRALFRSKPCRASESFQLLIEYPTPRNARSIGRNDATEKVRSTAKSVKRPSP